MKPAPDLWQDDDELRHCLEQALLSADVVKLSVEELQFLTGDTRVGRRATRADASLSGSLVLVTQGKES